MSNSNTTETLIGLLRSRDELGQSKYGATLDRTDLTPEDWLQHGLEEALDLAGYLQSAKREIGLIRGENIRLAMENLRLRSVLLPFVELAKAISLESPAEHVNTPPSYSVPTPSTPLPSISEPMPEIQSSIQVTPTEALEVPVQEDFPVLNILSSVKMLSTPPTTLSKPAKTYTTKELAEALGCHKDSIINYRRAGLIGEPVPGTGTSMTNLQRFEVPSFPALRKAIAERQEAAKKAMGRPQAAKSTPPEARAAFTPAPTPTFDIDDQGREAAIETGKAIYAKAKIFYLSRLATETRYSWNTQPSTSCAPGWEVVEEWRRNGLGRWESTPNIPGAGGVGTGIHRGAVQGVICG